MNPKTFELLTFLLWTAERLTRPTVRNLTDSYESWAYRNGFLQQLARLEKQKLIEHVPSDSEDRICRLTSEGRLAALGGRDPQAQWSRRWDGRWRLVIFDVPISRNRDRQRLRRYLHEKNFGFLQKSVWITPDPLREERKIIRDAKSDVTSLIMLEGRPCADETDSEIVAKAWDFHEINARYSRHLEILGRHPEGTLRDTATIIALRQWAADECQAWLNAVNIDPLLPQRLLPENYLGCTAWRRRATVLAQAGKQLQSYDSLP